MTYIKQDVAGVKTSLLDADKNLDKLRIKFLIAVASTLFAALLSLLIGYANHLLG